MTDKAYVVPENLLYTKEHEWVRQEDQIVVEGITDLAQHLLTDVVFVEMPELGTTVVQGKPFMVVESVKSVSDVFAAVSGEIIEINQAVVENPSLVNSDPYGGAWFVKIRPTKLEEFSSLLSPEAYTQFSKEAHH